MIRKVFLVLISLSLFLFFSCGSTKAETAVSEPEPPVQSEEVGEESAQNKEESFDLEEEDAKAEEEASSEETAGPLADDINELYPPLEEIEEPDLIELEPVEETEASDQEEEEKNQITEPVEEIEELPPLEPIEETESTEVTEGSEITEGEESEGENSEVNASEDGDENDESETAEESIKPTIEIETEEEAQEEIVIVPSRSVSLKKGETLVITYPGNGWIYMGSTSEYNNLASRGRKLGTTDTKYTLLAKESGTQIHHFYKVDNLTGEYIDDYIEVTVLEKKGKSSTVVSAPDYSELVPKKPESPAKASPKAAPKIETVEEAATTETPAPAAKAQPQTQPQQEAKAEAEAIVEPQNESQDDSEDSVIEIESEDAVIVIDEDNENAEELETIMEQARTSLSSKKYDDAYPALVQYLELSTDNRDEALYLLGQILESNSKYRDIKQAVETYQALCDNYPASKYWDKANKRIVYLKRFYINIH